MKPYILYSLIVLIIVGVAATYVATTPVTPTVPDTDQGDSISTPDNSATTSEPVGSSTALIEVSSPQPQTLVGKPLELRGQARGYWFFEGSAPVIVTNWDGLIIGESFITAEGDWMTEDYVPFTGSVSYDLPADSYSATGTIIFQKANPSGLPQHADAFEMTVELTPNATTPPSAISDNSDRSNLITCTDEQKAADFCTEEYAPVCGLQEVQCVTAPCDPIPQTYSNGCKACATPGVTAYSTGECAA